MYRHCARCSCLSMIFSESGTHTFPDHALASGGLPDCARLRSIGRRQSCSRASRSGSVLDRVAHEPGEMHRAAGSRISLTDKFIENVVPSLRCWHLDDAPLAARRLHDTASHSNSAATRLGIRMPTFCPIASRSARPNDLSAAVLRNCVCCEFARERTGRITRASQ